jgi:hypothetical protein
VERLDLRAGAPRAAWRPAPPMLYTRFAPGACALGSDLFVAGPPPLPRTNRTSLVPPPVLTGHAASLTGGWGAPGDATAHGLHARAALDSVEARGPPPPPTLPLY